MPGAYFGCRWSVHSGQWLAGAFLLICLGLLPAQVNLGKPKIGPDAKPQDKEKTPVRPIPLVDTDEDRAFPYQLEPPGIMRLFQLDSEDSFRERLRQELRSQGKMHKVEFPEGKVELSRQPFSYPQQPFLLKMVEPNYVCYRRLLFQQLNSERFGWDCGVLQPGLSTGTFVLDTLLAPLRLTMPPWRCYDSNAGYYLPGDPVPWQWTPLLWK